MGPTVPDQSTPTLEWALVIATKDRPGALKVCISLALEQTHPPAEVIVVDASSRWTDHAEMVGDLMADHPGIRFHYLQAAQPSLTIQRNQGIAQARAEILFLLDDDSFMYPDCAAQIMRIYQADTHKSVGGIQTGTARQAPRTDLGGGKAKDKGSTLIGAGGKNSRGGGLRWLARNVLLLDKSALFIPYDGEVVPLPPLPDGLSGYHVRPVRLFQGYRMTFRRQAVLDEPFDELLRYYCPGEDIDASYRVSRRHLLLTAPDALLHHFSAADGRVDRFRTTVLSVMNQAVLLRRHAADQAGARRRFGALMRRRLLAEALKDALSRRFGFPQARGVLRGMAGAKHVFDMTPDAIAEWYPAQQARILRG